jgi:hypothetical protein
LFLSNPELTYTCGIHTYYIHVCLGSFIVYEITNNKDRSLKAYIHMAIVTHIFGVSQAQLNEGTKREYVSDADI